MDVIAPADGRIVVEYFDVAVSRALPWKRRPQASRLLRAVRDAGLGIT